MAGRAPPLAAWVVVVALLASTSPRADAESALDLGLDRARSATGGPFAGTGSSLFGVVAATSEVHLSPPDTFDYAMEDRRVDLFAKLPSGLGKGSPEKLARALRSHLRRARPLAGSTSRRTASLYPEG